MFVFTSASDLRESNHPQNRKNWNQVFTIAGDNCFSACLICSFRPRYWQNMILVNMNILTMHNCKSVEHTHGLVTASCEKHYHACCLWNLPNTPPPPPTNLKNLVFLLASQWDSEALQKGSWVAEKCRGTVCPFGWPGHQGSAPFNGKASFANTSAFPGLLSQGNVTSVANLVWWKLFIANSNFFPKNDLK